MIPKSTACLDWLDTSRTRTAGAVVLTALWGLVLAGCVDLESLRHPSRPVAYYSIDYPCPARVVEKPLAGVLRIKPFAVVDTFATDRILYEESPYSLGSSYYDRWIASPVSLVTAALARDLSESGIFPAVVRTRGILEPDWEMAGTLESLKAKKREGRWETEITVHVLLYPWPDRGAEATRPERIFQKRYTVSTPCGDERPVSVVRSLSTGMERLSDEMLQDIARHVGAVYPEPASP